MAANSKSQLKESDAFSLLRGMIDKTVIFRGKQFRIVDVDQPKENVFQILKDTGSTVSITTEKVEAFISECFVTESLLPAQSAQLIVQPIFGEDMLDNMIDKMHGAFQELSSNPTKETIAQAQAMSSAANTVSDLIKLKIAAKKMRLT